MSRSYEELSGASGRARYFRPSRFQAGELFAGAPPLVYFDDEAYSLLDLSGSGLGCRAEGEGALESVNRRGVLRLVQRGRELFRGKARQARYDIGRGGATTGFALEECAIDLKALRRGNARALAAGIADAPPDAEPSQEYKVFCSDVSDFIGGFLNRIDRHLTPLEGELEDADIAEIIAELDHAAAPRWLDLIGVGNRLVLPIHEDKKTREIYKAYTERALTRTLLAGAGWARSYFKPLGYPGDFQIMNWIYDGVAQGSTLKDMFIHQLSLIGSHAVKTRMDALADLMIDANLSRGQTDRPFDMVSIGCGPAREIEPVLDRSDPRLKWRMALVDQEPLALESALGLARRVGGARLEAQALNISFKEMLNPSPLAESFMDKDLIYSSGMVDYLNPLLAQRFVKRLYHFVRPGGRVIIGNVNNLPTGMIWSSEYAVDWSLYFRSREDMIAMANEAPGAKVSIRSDSLEAIYFLIVEKPRD